MNTVTLKDSSLNAINREIGNLSRSFNSTANKIQAIAGSILAGYEQAASFDGKEGGNAYCQKIPVLINTVYKFSPARAKDIIQFFTGKIPFGIISRDGEYRLSKLDWGYLKAPEVLAAEAQAKANNRKAQAESRKAEKDSVIKKAAQAESLAEQNKALKAELDKVRLALKKAEAELQALKAPQQKAA